jgi:hypothetical protein
MKTRDRMVASLLVAIVSAVVGCGDGGPNRGSQCSQVLNAACDRLGGDCMLIPSNQINVCVQSGLVTCCDGSCSASVVSTQAEIDACVADVNAATCDVLDVTAGGTLPASCQGVVRSSLTAAAVTASDSVGAARLGELLSR